MAETEYGVTDKGFVLKRMDTILEEVHADLTQGFGVDTRLSRPSLLDVLVTSFCGKIADLWEVAQDSYYAKYPATANGVNLDNAVQYGGIRREANKKTVYPLHCTGDDGTHVRLGMTVASNTSPEVRLQSTDEFTISRDYFNKVAVIVAAEQSNTVYSVSINGNLYSYKNTDGGAEEILEGLKNAITDETYSVSVDAETGILMIEDSIKSRANSLELTDNLTTSSVTVVANFATEEYGKFTLPKNIVTKMINNITGFAAVTNLLEPTYGRNKESDIELRQSYAAKSSLRANTMVESIVAELLNNVDGVTSAQGYENNSDEVSENGMLPHSIEIVVEGGDENVIAETILKKKAGGIGTNGDVQINVEGLYGDKIPIRFSRPENIYVWLKVKVSGNSAQIPSDYKALVTESIIEDAADMHPGTSLITQMLLGGIYGRVSGITDIEILTASSKSESIPPDEGSFVAANVTAEQKQKIIVSSDRIEVTLNDS